MAIKNYTSGVDVYTSLGEIQGALAQHGARQTMVEYDDQGRPTGVAFAIDTPNGRRGFMLPANIGGTGYKDYGSLPREIEATLPDYSIYPQVKHAIGFLTRGCIRNCPWCIVPRKEGGNTPGLYMGKNKAIGQP